MVLQERREHQHTRHLDPRRDILTVGLAWPHGADIAAGPDRPRGDHGRGFVADRVEDVVQGGRGRADLVDDVRVPVVEDVRGAGRADQIGVARAACGHYLEAVQGGELDGV